MPRTKRLQLKRFWAQGKNDLEKAVVEILRLQEIFAPSHPEYAELADHVLISIYVALEGWDAFATHAWGDLPKHTLDWMA